MLTERECWSIINYFKNALPQPLQDGWNASVQDDHAWFRLTGDASTTRFERTLVKLGGRANDPENVHFSIFKDGKLHSFWYREVRDFR